MKDRKWEKVNEKVQKFVEWQDAFMIADSLSDLLFYEEKGFGDWTVREIVDFLRGVLDQKIKEMREKEAGS